MSEFNASNPINSSGQKPGFDPDIKFPVEREKVTEETKNRMDAGGLGSLANTSSKGEAVQKLSEIAIGFRVCRDMEKKEKERKKKKREIENT